MDSTQIRSLLGALQADPDSQEAWSDLTAAVMVESGDLAPTELFRLLDAARLRHSERGEWEAVARVLEVQIRAARSLPQEPALVLELARVQTEELFDDDGATISYRQFLELVPGDQAVSLALDEIETKRLKRAELLQSYLTEAEQAADDLYASSMLMRASEVDFRFGGEDADLDAASERLERSVRLDAGNERAGHLLERIYRKLERWDEVARVLERMADRGPSEQSRAAAGIRLARLYQRRLEDRERAAQAYERVLRNDAVNKEAMEFLSGFYSGAERWGDLVRLYESELKHKESSSSDRLGDCLQVALIHWRKRESLEDAEPWFDRVRKLDPAHAGALEFYRAYCKAKGDEGKLLTILQDAQRALPDQSARAALAKEIALLAEGQANAQKAIEQYRNVLRSTPDDDNARASLKRLYRQTQGYTALVELLRQELERVPMENLVLRLQILREVAGVYREHLKSDTALVSILNQIVHLDEKLDQNDVAEVRELVELYEKLGRWRDLLSTQLLLAEISPDVEEKKRLYRAAARRWLEQFSNAQQATESYRALLKLDPTDGEARERLEELYRKRRAWPELFELYQAEVQTAPDEKRLGLLQEMSRLCAERLARPKDAIELCVKILEAQPARTEALDYLERIAEKTRDHASLALALERRVALALGPQEKLGHLQRLGSVYSDHLGDEERALETWKQVLELVPGQPRALRVLRDAYLGRSDFQGLEELYAAQADWEGLAEVLSTAADRATEASVKVDLSYRAARVYNDKLGQPDRAFRSYERILSVDPRDGQAIRALIPLYEADEKWARLPPLYEALVGAETSREVKLELFGKLLHAASKLSDRQAVLEYSRRAYELDPSNLSALEAFEAASRAVGNFQTFVNTLEESLAHMVQVEKPEPEARKSSAKRRKQREDAKASKVEAATPEVSEALRHATLVKLAQVYAGELKRPLEAIKIYKGLLEQGVPEPNLVQQLEALLAAEHQWDDMRWLFERRVRNALSSDEQVELYFAWAELEQKVLANPGNAIERLKSVLEIDATHPLALDRVAALLLASGEVESAAPYLERHKDMLAGEERAERLIAIARLYGQKLGRPEEALERASEALSSAVWRTEAVSVLEELLGNPIIRAKAASVLAKHYRDVSQPKDECRVLLLLLGETEARSERLDLVLRVSDALEKRLASASQALDVILAEVRLRPSETVLWDRAEELARLSNRPSELAETFREVLSGEVARDLSLDLSNRAARLHEDRLGDPVGATPYLERVLALNPADETAFVRLKDILTARERWGELEALYDRASAVTPEVDRKVEMLFEVALVCEEIIENPERAVRYYEKIIEVDENHEGARAALERLYEQLDRKKPLAELLERRLGEASGEDLLKLRNRLGRLRLDLLEPEKAIEYVEFVLTEEPSDYDARTLAERMLEIGDLRVRAARKLEVAYEVRHEIRSLDKMLIIRLEDLRNRLVEESSPALVAEQREVLRRLAQLRDDKLHDDEAAIETLSELVPLEPEDEAARGRLLEVAGRLGAPERAAKVLLNSAQNASSVAVRGQVLLEAGRLFETVLDAPEKAADAFNQVLSLEGAQTELLLAAAHALERIYERKVGRASDPDERRAAQRALLGVFRRISEHELDGARRRDYLARLAKLADSELGDTEAAVGAWRERLEEDPDDSLALAELDQLFQKSEKWPELVSVLERRRELALEAGGQRSLLFRIAELKRDKLGSRAEAISAYREVLEAFGPSTESLSALESLYEMDERWDELNDALEQHIELVDTDQERLALITRLGIVKGERLEDSRGALETYRRGLAINPQHQASREALTALMRSRDVELRREAAETLHGLYEDEGLDAERLRVIEVQIEASDDPLDKLEKLREALKLAEGPLDDPARAQAYVEQGVFLACGFPELPEWLEHLDRLTTRRDAYGRQAELLSDLVPQVMDGDIKLSIYHKLAALSRERLNDVAKAQQCYEKALEHRPDDRVALMQLESLFAELGQHSKLLEVLEKRIEGAESDEETKGLLYRKAELLAGPLAEAEGAAEAYQAVLDLGFETRAVVALERLYEELGRFDDLVELYQRELDAPSPSVSRAELRVKLAQTLAFKLGHFDRGLDELEAALETDPNNHGPIRELEKILEQAEGREHRGRAGALLEPIYLRRAAYDDVMKAIEARLQNAEDPTERRTLLSRLAKLHEEQKEDYNQALETVARMLTDGLDDENVVSELERLARVAGAWDRLAAIYAGELDKVVSDDRVTSKISRRVGELYEGQGQVERALVYYRRALAFEPESHELFARVDALLDRGGLEGERIELHRAGLEHRFDPKERLLSLHTIAKLQRATGQADLAIATYREALEVDAEDAVSVSALAELFRQAERWHELAELWQSEAQAAPQEQAVERRLELARLYRAELEDPERAVDELELVVEMSPNHPRLIGELETLRANPGQKLRVVAILKPLYEAKGDWRRLVQLNEDRFQLSEDARDRIEILRDTAELWNLHGKDPDRARRALEEALRIDPDDLTVREEYEALVRKTTAWRSFTELYESLLSQAPPPSDAVSLLRTLSQVYDRELDDARAALDAFGRWHQADPGDTEPLARMEQLAVLLGDWARLVEVLTSKAQLSDTDAERASALRYLGEVRRDMLEDQAGACRAYEEALNLEPEHAFTLDCLIDLYESSGNAVRLVELYEERGRLAADDDQLRYELLMRAARRFERDLGEGGRAVEALERALEMRAMDAAALKEVQRLYRSQERWQDLVESLRQQVSFTSDPETVVGLRREMAELLARQTQNYEEALDAYAQVLEASPADEKAQLGVLSIAEGLDVYRERCAEILVPVLRSTASHERLVTTLELLLTVESDPSEQVRILREMAVVLEGSLHRPADARAALLRALAHAPEVEEVHRDIERLSSAKENFADYAERLEERALATFDPDLARDLFTRLAVVAEERLSDDERAISAYRRALEHSGDEPAILLALDRLYGKNRQFDDLLEILERRALAETDERAQADLYCRIGQLQAEEFKALERGIASFGVALERVFDHPATLAALEEFTQHRELFDHVLELLEPAYRKGGQIDRLVSLHEKRIDLAESAEERVAMRRRLARVLEDDNKSAQAQRVLQSALLDAPSDGELIDEIDRLAAITSDYRGAADALSRALREKRKELPDAAVAESYERVGTWYAERVGDLAAAESALKQAIETEPTDDRLLEKLEHLQRRPGSERDLVATLERRSKLAASPRDYLEEAAKLSSELGDTALLERLLGELLSTDGENLWALAELTKLLMAKGDYEQAFELLVKQSEVAVEGQVVRELRQQAAAMAREHLGDLVKAADLYEKLYDEDPLDLGTSALLLEIHATSRNFIRVAQILARLVEQSDSTADRTRHRLHLARVQAEQLLEESEATETLQSVLEEEPGQLEAVRYLSELLEKAGKHRELSELLRSEVEQAASRGDSEKEARLEFDLAELLEVRLGDRRAAIEVYERVARKRPDDKQVLEALARLYEEEGQLEKSLDFLDRLFLLSTGEEASRLAEQLVEARLAMGDKPSAVRVLERTRELDPADVRLPTKLEQLYRELGDMTGLSNLLVSLAKSKESRVERAHLLKRAAAVDLELRNQPAKAASLLKEASDLVPDDRELLLELCDAYGASGQADLAIDTLEKVVDSYGGKRAKELAEVHRRLASAYEAKGDVQRTLEELDKAFRIEPGNIGVLRQLGVVALEASDLKRAQQMFRALLLQKLDGKSPITKAEVFMYLGEVHERLGEKDKAIQMLERAVQTDAALGKAKERLEGLRAG